MLAVKYVCLLTKGLSLRLSAACFSVSRRWEYAWIHFEATIAYLPSLVVDAEGKIL